MLESQRIHQVLRYAVAVAANEDDYRRRELGPIHLIKYLYLADLAYAEKHGGETLTGLSWRFHHFGPWALEAFQELDPAMAPPEFQRRSFQGSYQDDVVRYRTTDQGLEDNLESELPRVVERAAKDAVQELNNDTSALLHHVYCTQPMVTAAPGETLDFSVAVKPSAKTDAAPARLLRKEQRQEAHEQLQARFRAALKRRTQTAGAVAEPRPRYDEVFAKGQEWLDRQAGEPLEPLEGELIVSEEVWKSPARSEPGLS